MEVKHKTHEAKTSHGDSSAASTQDALGQLRALRLELLAKHPGLSKRAQERLEAEPFLREGPDWSAYDLSVLTMRLGYRHRRNSSGAYLSSEETRARGQLGFPERFAIRCALNEALPVNDLRTLMLRGIRENRDFAGLLHRSFYDVGHPERRERLDADRHYLQVSAQTAIARSCRLLGLDAMRLGQQFIESFSSHAARAFQAPVFHRAVEGAPRSIEAEPQFRSFLRSLSREKNITAWIESQPDVSRSYGCSLVPNRSIVNLEFTAYDTSRVKEFTLSNARGSELQVVSKRLGPIKSATAELEFERSKELFTKGVPTPQPVAIIRDRGNTYFLWKKVESDSEIAINFPDETTEQRQDILKQIHSLGYVHLDVAERNFLFTMEDGKPKVWIIDLERMRRA